jgi:hypothetical protein
MKRLGFSVAAIACLAMAGTVQGQASRAVDLGNSAYRQQRAAELFQQADEARQRAADWAARTGEPVRFERDGRVFLLVDYTDPGGPIYRATHNANAGISTAANLVRAAPYGLTGTNWLAGIWDGGNVRDTHTEFNGRVVNSNSAGLSDHATHVSGTMIARGTSSSAIGMATQARLEAYDFNSDLAEMTLRAMATPSDTNKLQISNHSYGYISGWEYSFSPPRWYGTWGNQESDSFGRYDTYDRDLDKLLYEAPYYQPFSSAGNDRNNNAPAIGTTFEYFANNAWRQKTYDPATDPYSDGWWLGGHDTIPFGSVAKNLMLVGAVNDAVTSGSRDIGKATMTTFSAWGPTDDGRVKPDVVANGASLTSALSGGDSSYGIMSGTSMACPNASGSAILILQRHGQLFPGSFMRASMIKALILHTADDLHTPGPDYRTGWGLMNTKAAVDHLELFHSDIHAPRMVEAFVSTTNTVAQYQAYWDGVSPIKATLVWTDPPGIARTGLNNTNLALRNNLDLRVITPSGTTNFPWILDPANPTNAATTGNNFRDNVEQVYIASPGTEGRYTFRVSYSGTLSNNFQRFSLAVSGIANDPASGVRLEGDLNFGDMEVDSASWRLLTVHNDNVAAVNITNISYPSGFSGSWTGSISALGSRDVSILFQPAATGVYGSTLAVSLAETTTQVVRAISGTGVRTLALSITNPPGDVSVSNAVDAVELRGGAGSAVVGLLSWTNAGTGGSGTTAAQSNWSVSGVSLAVETNAITVSGTNHPVGGVWASDAVANAAYADGWSTGDNGGNGYHSWILAASGANAGHFLANSVANTNLDIGTEAWGLWANSGDQASAYRPFGRPLQSGDTVKVAFENQWVSTGGSVGVALLNPDGQYLVEFLFAGGGSTYTVNDSASSRDTGVAYTDAGLDLAFTLTGSNTYQLAAGAGTLTGTLASRSDMTISRFRAWNHSAGTGGSYNFYINDLQVTNAPGQPSATSATVRIVRLGFPPTVDPIPALSIIAGQTLAYTVTASNPEGDPMTFSCATEVPTNRWTLDPSTGSFQFTPEPADAGLAAFDFTATDKDGDSAPVTMSVTVEAPPAFVAIGMQSATTGVATSFVVSATGYPAPTLALAETTASSGYGFTPATGVLNYTPPYGDAGSRFFTFTAANTLGVDTQVVEVAVTLAPPQTPLLWVAQTNASRVLAEWTSAGATGYVFDAHTDASFLNLIPGSGGFEDFSNIGASSSSYETRIWTNNGIVWTGYLARTDLTIDGPAIGLQNSAGYFVSQPISGGVDELSIAHRRNSGAPTSFDVFINSVKVATNVGLGTSVATTTVAGISVAGDFIITVTNNGNNVAIFDNLSWTNPPVPGGDFVPGYSNRPVAETSLSVTGLVAGTSYYLRVRAGNEAGLSDWSNVEEAVPATNNVIEFPAIDDQVVTNVLGLSAAASSGLPVSFAVQSGPAVLADGTNLSFTATGSVAVVASQAGDESWPAADEVTNRFEVFKATAIVQLNALAQIYDGTPRIVTAATDPAELTVVITYDGESTAPTAAGSYAVTGTVVEANYLGSASGTLVVDKAEASVTLGALTRIFDGTSKAVTVSTDPANLAVAVTYDGSPNAPSAIGDYEVAASIDELNFAGSAMAWLSIASSNTLYELWLADEQGQDPQNPDFTPDEDADGDGMTNWEEFLADTNPDDPGHLLALDGNYAIAAAEGAETGAIRFEFLASSNRFYQLVYSTNLFSPTIVSNLGWGVPPAMTLTNRSTGTWYGGIRVLLEDPHWP